jgi:DNA replication protein DnaC
MLYEQTLTKLHSMKLQGMAEALNEQRSQTQIADLSFEDRLALLVDRQWLWKENRALTTRLRYAKLKIQASLEDIDFRHPRGLLRSMIDQLASSDWIKHHQNCIITGPTGVGKTYLGCALAQRACRDGYRALYYYAPKLFRQLATAHADGSFASLLKKLARADLVVIDDWGLDRLKEPQYRDFLEILDDRHGSASTLMTSQFATNSWHDVIGNPTIADAILDRLVHNAYRIELKGDSMRKLKTNHPLTNNQMEAHPLNEKTNENKTDQL